jgi:Alpha-tubulin suppressor and related RCC1 domain-containing proteins
MTTKRYTVTVITGSVQDADTRANVYLTLNGTLASSPENHLKGEFGIGTTREFGIDSPDLGNLEGVDIRHDNTGDAPNWFLDKVIVKEEGTGAEWVFACGEWLRPPTLSRTLLGEILTLRRGWAWGQNAYGQLCDGANINRSAPVEVLGLTRVKAIAAGSFHGLALLEDGTVLAWGYNAEGQLGDDATTQRHASVEVSALTGVKAIAAGHRFSLALLKDGTVRAWGYNAEGQLGDGTPTQRNTPVKVSGLTGVKAIAAGERYSLALG